MRQLARRPRALIAAALAVATLAADAANAQVRQVYLVQNSGWMEPYYTDPASQLRPLVAALAERTAVQGTEIVVASFNQDGQVAGETSPREVYRGAYAAGAVEQAVGGVTLPRKASGAYADTDLRGALKGALAMLPGDGIVWIVTNNKNSPDNSQAVDANTQAFYRQVRDSPSISGIAAFIVRNPVQGEKFSEQGLVVYGMARGPGGAKALERAVAGGPLPGSTPALRLKPLDRQPIRFEVVRVHTQSQAGVTADTRGGVLRIGGVPGGKPSLVRLEARLVNTLYPYTIARATLRPQWTALQGASDRGTARFRVSPATITDVGAIGDGSAAPVTLDIALPPLHRPKGEGLDALTAEGATLRGVVDVNLDDVELAFDPAFLEQAYALMRVDPAASDAEAQLRRRLPEIYFAHERIDSAVTKIPVELTVAFSAWPLLARIAGLLLLLLALLAALAWARRPVVWRSPTLGREVRIKPGETQRYDTPLGPLTIRRPPFGAVTETLGARQARA